MRSEFLSMNVASAVVKAMNIMRPGNPGVQPYFMRSGLFEGLGSVDKLVDEPVREFDGVKVGKTVYWLDILDQNGLNKALGDRAKAYIRGVHFSGDGMELGETSIIMLKDQD